MLISVIAFLAIGVDKTHQILFATSWPFVLDSSTCAQAAVNPVIFPGEQGLRSCWCGLCYRGNAGMHSLFSGSATVIVSVSVGLFSYVLCILNKIIWSMCIFYANCYLCNKIFLLLGFLRQSKRSAKCRCFGRLTSTAQRC